jgi:peptidoglycan-associated lipoprotein
VEIPVILTRKTLTVLAVASVAVLAAACATKPKYPVGPAHGPDHAENFTPPAHGGPADNGVTSENGAPLPGTARDFEQNAGDRVFFDYDQYAVRPDAAPVLAAQAAWLQRYPSVTIRIEGNADERGTREYNFALGASRANSVRDYLVNHGVSPSRIQVISYGKERPIDNSGTDEGMAKNRNGHTVIVSGAR